jgi:hypothetical protein
MFSLFRLPVVVLTVLACGSGCATRKPECAPAHVQPEKYQVNFECNADWFLVDLEKDSDARFVLPDNPGIWIKDAQEQVNSVKLSTTTLHIHRTRNAQSEMVIHNFHIESSRPEIKVRIDHGANGRVVVRSGCDAFTTHGRESQTIRLRLCRE